MEVARHVVIDMSDLHCGHRLGLLNPKTKIMQGCTTDLCDVALGVVQRRLWRAYKDHMNAAAAIAGDDQVTLVFKGDLTHGTKHKEGLAYICLADQLAVAFWCIMPWFERNLNIKKIVIVEGTEAHTHYSSTESLLSMWLASHYPNIDIIYTGHGLLETEAMLLDMAHHGAHPGSRCWLDGNSLRLYGNDILISNLMEGTEPPRVVSRAHFHEYRHEVVRRVQRGREWTIDLFLTPSYCGLTGYGRKATRSMPYLVNGMVVHEIRGGLYNYHPLMEKVDLRTVVRLYE